MNKATRDAIWELVGVLSLFGCFFIAQWFLLPLIVVVIREFVVQ